MTFKHLIFTSAACVAVGAPAAAQVAAAEETVGAGLEEVIVTAQKREQNLQNVPVAVTAITGEALAERNINQFDDLTRVTPSLTITKGPNLTGATINLRGIGTFAFSTGVEPSVAVVVDDLAMLQQGQAFATLSDIDRVEVLRGPQGTLFGKGASAGVINVVTQAPATSFSGSATSVLTTDEQYRFESAISAPLGEAAGFRINGFYEANNGFIDNLVDARNFGRQRNWGVRGRLDFSVTDTLNVSLNANHAESRTNGNILTLFTTPAGARQGGIPIEQIAAGTHPGYGNDRVRIDHDTWEESTTSTVSVKATLELGAVDLVSVTGYQDWRYDFLQDLDGTASPILGIAGGVFQGGPIEAELFSQELRLISAEPGLLEYLVGLYYADGTTTRDSYRQPAGPLLSGYDATNGSTTYAAFAQATLNLSDTTHVDGGLRFNREEIEVDYVNTAPTTSGGNCVVACIASASDDQVTGKIAVRQDLAPDVMAFVSYATGYKGQGYDISTGFTPTKAANPARPEHSKAYEIGLKSRFFDDRAQLNLTAFLTNYEDFQAQSLVNDPVTGAAQFQLDNVGRLRTKGVEIEMLARPVPELSVNASAAYTKAKILEFPPAACYTAQTAAQGCVGGVQDLADAPVANSPELKYSIAATYDIELATLPFDAFVGTDYRHQSSVIFDLFQNPATRQRSYGIMNADVGIKSDAEGAYRVSLFVNNLFDKAYAINLGVPAAASTGELIIQALPRDYTRYFGIRMSAQF